MNEAKLGEVLNNPTFRALARKKSIFAVILTLLVCITYYGLILLIAFYPELIAQTITANSVISYGLPMGVGVILLSILFTGIYVWRSNTHYDRLLRKVIKEIGE